MSDDSVKEILAGAIRAQKDLLRTYERPSEVLTFETLRALDDLFCRELFPEGKDGDEKDCQERGVMSWGINHALRRIIPDRFETGPFRLFCSTRDIQVQADNFVFDCGTLGKAEKLLGWLHEGLFRCTIHPVSPEHASIGKILVVLQPSTLSAYAEAIGHRGGRWWSERTQRADRSKEEALERRHVEILPELTQRVDVLDGWGITYGSDRATDDYFLEWGRLYLRRILFSEMIDPDDVIGGRPFRTYLEVLAALAGRAQMHLCYAGLLKHKRPGLLLRNLLTSAMPFEVLMRILASRLDADTLEMQRLVSHLTLEPSNKQSHTDVSDPAWAPLVRASNDNVMLPLYGLEINPFLFLLNDLRWRYPNDWFRVANRREERWIQEIVPLFPAPRWIAVGRSVKLRDRKTEVTDIDFAAYDTATAELALFQLKWQQPVNADGAARRSTGKNLTSESNRWIKTVTSWLDKYGTAELTSRLGLRDRHIAAVRLFVLGRYHAFFSGYDEYAEEATWSDWNHFLKVRTQRPNSSPSDLADKVTCEIEAARATSNRGESVAFPIADVAVVVNPASMPAEFVGGAS